MERRRERVNAPKMLTLFALPLSLAAEPTFVYDLTVNGQPAGTRTVEIQYLMRPDGERRIDQVVTDLKLASEAWKVRATSTSSSRGAAFTASVDRGGKLTQVQGVEQLEGGWRMSFADSKGTKEYAYARTDARISSLDLYDPGRSWRLGAVGPFGIVLAETGDAIVGTLGEAVETTVLVDGVQVPVRRYSLGGTGGVATFDLDVQGQLIRSEMGFLGTTVVSTLRKVPPLRTIDTVQTIEGLAVPIRTEEL